MKKIIFSLMILFFGMKIFADVEDTVRNQIPGKYYSSCEKAGTTQLFKYKAGNGEHSAVIYLPYGYDEAETHKKYPVLFLMHGGGGSSANYLGPAMSPNQLAWIIDNAINTGEIEPLIIVCPNDNGSFFLELRKFLIPAIDEKFNTKANRENRAFGGFSMGAVATWNVFLHDLDLVKYFIPMSGDSWVCGSTGGKVYPEKTADFLSKADHIHDYNKNDYFIFAATGLSDMAYANMTPQINAMKEIPDVFQYTNEDFSKGNFMYYVVRGNVHSYNHTYEYIYNALKLFSKIITPESVY